MVEVGDKVYLANDSGVDTYIVDKIDGDTAMISYDSHIMKLSTSFSIKRLQTGDLPCLFTDYNKAKEKSKQIKADINKRTLEYFDHILEEALNSKCITVSDVVKHGELLRSKKKIIEKEGNWILSHEAYLYKYEGKRYIIICKYINGYMTECLRFEKL